MGNLIETGRDIIRKHSSVITAVAGSDVPFKAIDITVFNYLQLRARNDTTPGQVFQIPVKDVMQYFNFDRVARVHETLQRLSKGVIEIDYEDENGQQRMLYCHFLSSDVSISDNGMLMFAFDPILAHFITDPKVYALISVNRSKDLKSMGAKRLYELMSLQYRKHSPIWEVTVDEFRQIMQIGDRYPRYDNLKRHVIDKIVAEVNAIAEFDVIYDQIRGGPGGGIVALKFTAVSKSHDRLLQAKSVNSSKARKSTTMDEYTVDMLDGMTGRERGGPAEVTSDAIETARSKIGPEDDLNLLLGEWRDQHRGLSMLDPDAHFLTWLDQKLTKASDPLLNLLDDDVFGDLLGGD